MKRTTASGNGAGEQTALALEPAELETRIAEREAELAGLVAERTKELDALRLLLRAANVAKHGKPPRAVRGTGKAALRAAAKKQGPDAPRKGGRPSTASRIADYLGEAGKRLVNEIVNALEISREAALHALNNDDRFDMDAAGHWFLTPDA